MSTEIIQFHQRNGRFPMCSTHSFEERRIGNLLKRFRQIAESNTLDQNVAELDAKFTRDVWAPTSSRSSSSRSSSSRSSSSTSSSTSSSVGFMNAKELHAMERVNELVEFYKQHRRFPSQLGSNPEEKSLGFWLLRIRSTLRGKGEHHVLYESVCSSLDNFFGRNVWCPSPNANEEKSLENARSVIQFYEEHGNFPSANSTSNSVEETKLGQWLANIRRAERGKTTTSTLYDSVRDLLDKHFTRDVWCPSNDVNEQESLENARNLIQFHNQHGRFPSDYSKYQEERRIGKWLSRARKSIRGKGVSVLYDSVRDLLDSYFGSRGIWCPSNDIKELKALENAKTLIQFHNQHERFPSGKSKDPEEKRLGIWLSNMRSASRGNGGMRLYDSVRDLLDSYFGSRDIWCHNETSVSSFSTSSSLDSVRELINFHENHNQNVGIWLQQQRGEEDSDDDTDDGNDVNTGTTSNDVE